MTEVIEVDAIIPDRDKLGIAASCLLRGGLVAFPTETVYGLGADCFDDRAVRKIFEVKNRPADNPLIVHISSKEQFGLIASDIPELAWRVCERAWPGPITVVVRKAPELPRSTTGGLQSAAVRMPAHPVALGLISESGKALAAPSANLSGKPSPTNARHVVEDLSGKIELILDAGDTFFGVESTIVDLTAKTPTLLRPGPFTVEELEKVLGDKVVISKVARGFAEAEVALAPGMKHRHYAPKAKMVLVEVAGTVEEMQDSVLLLARKNIKLGERVGILCSDETKPAYIEAGLIAVSLGTRSNLFTVAKSLYKALREIDSSNVTMIISEAFDEKGVGLAIMNRLRRASSQSVLRS